MLRAYIRWIDAMNYRIGRFAMYGIFAMIGILLWSSFTKIASVPSLWTLEAAQFAIIAYFFIGGPYSIQMGSHVRMDLFYERWSAGKKALVDGITALFLLVYLAVLLWGAVGSTAYSLGHFGSEPFGFLAGIALGSEEVGTLERSRTIWRPYLWPIKVVMCIGIALMLLQALSELFKDILRLRGEALEAIET
ncbi:TRAP transporter small permease subunit [Thioalkalivibrio sp. HK1]|uniref:TRAP transporter small permease subunit n=1 Tax=Thioalkalivibrio sp. HK1 TaxID=1469245 RepID=UPI0018CC2009|nr:TRAP transporter small permease subunit [Thioalkalivibrio sp. HK1]